MEKKGKNGCQKKTKIKLTFLYQPVEFEIPKYQIFKSPFLNQYHEKHH